MNVSHHHKTSIREVKTFQLNALKRLVEIFSECDGDDDRIQYEIEIDGELCEFFSQFDLVDISTNSCEYDTFPPKGPLTIQSLRLDIRLAKNVVPPTSSHDSSLCAQKANWDDPWISVSEIIPMSR